MAAALAEKQEVRLLALSAACLRATWPSAAPRPVLRAHVQFSFGPWKIAASEVFALTGLSYAFVNLKPVVPGAICMRRATLRHAHVRCHPHLQHG